jgi:hypothetical protein
MENGLDTRAFYQINQVLPPEMIARRDRPREACCLQTKPSESLICNIDQYCQGVNSISATPEMAIGLDLQQIHKQTIFLKVSHHLANQNVAVCNQG